MLNGPQIDLLIPDLPTEDESPYFILYIGEGTAGGAKLIAQKLVFVCMF